MIKVDYNKLPNKYSVVRGSAVTHIFVYSHGQNRENIDEHLLVEGNYLCNERNTLNLLNTHEPYLTCKKCSIFYDEVLSNEIEKRYMRYKW